MSDEPSSVASRAREQVEAIRRSVEFAQELLRENERLRGEIEALRREGAAPPPAAAPGDAGSDRERLIAERDQALGRLSAVEMENARLGDRYAELEQENDRLAHFHVASRQLHSTLEFGEVLKIVIEISINLIGAEVVVVYAIDDRSGELRPIAAEGRALEQLPAIPLDDSTVGRAVRQGEPVYGDEAASEDSGAPLVSVPMCVQDRKLGAIVIYRLLPQKQGFTALDRELFEMLGGHAAAAALAAETYTRSERKLQTIQGFLDLLGK